MNSFTYVTITKISNGEVNAYSGKNCSYSVDGDIISISITVKERPLTLFYNLRDFYISIEGDVDFS